LDEEWSFVRKKRNKRWLWLVISRKTKQIIAYFIGDRTTESCKKLEEKIPERYKETFKFSDLWDSYNKIFPDNHMSVEKGSGETCYIERFNNTIRQRLGRYTRKTLSFSKSDYCHDLVTHLFIIHYNLSLRI
jgi:insertion element IS1 protein InsB